MSTSLLRLEGELSIYRAGELKQALLAPLEPSTALEVDLSAVAELDTAGVQLLMLAKKSAQEKQCELRLIAHSPAVLEVLELLNLVAYFGDPLIIAPLAESAAGRTSSKPAARYPNES